MTVTVMTSVMRRMRQVGRICFTSFTPTPSLSSSPSISSTLKELFALQDFCLELPDTIESNSTLVCNVVIDDFYQIIINWKINYCVNYD